MNDSWQYRFAYLIRSRGEFPEDFPAFEEDTLLPALFLPRDEPDWFGRSANPPRVVMLKRNILEAHFHPQSGKSFAAVRFDECLSVQSGRFLLVGWLGFASPTGEIRLPYHRRVDEPVRQFLGIVRARLLALSGAAVSDSAHLGDALELKFENILRDELDRGENEQLRFFIAPRVAPGRRWLFRAKSWRAGDLVALSGRRIIWVTERCHGAREIYGDVVSWAALENVSRLVLRTEEAAFGITVVLRNGKVWSMEVPERLLPEARRFVSIAMERLQLLRFMRA